LLTAAGSSAFAAGSLATAATPETPAFCLAPAHHGHAEIVDAVERWRALWRADEELPDFDSRGAELRRQAYDLEFEIAAMVPSTIEAYYAKRQAVEMFELDDENFTEIVFQLGHDAGRLGVDGEMPDNVCATR
jgi:hypothetical protein